MIFIISSYFSKTLRMESLKTPFLAGLFTCCIFFITQINFSGFSPVIPAVGHYFSLNNRSAQLILSYGFAGYMIGQLIWGTISDYIGRSTIIIINLFIYIILALAITQTKLIASFQIIYVLMGVFVATFTSVGNAILKDRYQSEDYLKMVATVGIIMGAGPALGPILSGSVVTISHGKWQMAFVLISAIGLIILIGFSCYGRYKKESSPIALGGNHIQLILSNHRYWLSLLSFSLFFGIVISYLSSGPFILSRFFLINTARLYFNLFPDHLKLFNWSNYFSLYKPKVQCNF